MKNSHNIYLISDSTGETLDRIFLALKAQFKNFDYQVSQEPSQLQKYWAFSVPLRIPSFHHLRPEYASGPAAHVG